MSEEVAYLKAYDGTNNASLRTASAGNVSGHTGQGVLLTAQPGQWTEVHVPAAATQATKTHAAESSKRHVCTGIIATIACATTAQTPLKIYLRDGATGAGTILAAFTVAAPANGCGGVAFTGLSIYGTVGTAMTLEFSGVGVAASEQAVTLLGYTAE